MTFAKKTPAQIQWATFLVPVRISTQGTVVPAVIAGATTKLTKDTWEGETVLVVDDVGISEPIRVPWHAVGSFGVPR